MKKRYKTPSLICVKIASGGTIAGSLGGLNVNSEGSSVNKDDAWVKEDISSKPYRYNVWDDDWSE